jgi:hypothetical protein
MTYNVALDGSRALRHAASLINANAVTLTQLGVSPDSIAALIRISDQTGIPIRSPAAEGTQAREGLAWLGRLDDTRDSLHGRTLTTYADVNHDRPVALSPLAAPSTSGTEHRATLGGQFVMDDYRGTDQLTLTETRVAVSMNRFSRTQGLSAPSASVLVQSDRLGAERLKVEDPLGVVTLVRRPDYSRTSTRRGRRPRAMVAPIRHHENGARKTGWVDRETVRTGRDGAGP